MVKILSVSFRNDELDRIDELMKEYDMNRHQVIKLAVRRFLFPHEKTVPLGEKKLNCMLQSKENPTPTENSDDDTFGEAPPFLKDKQGDDIFEGD